ncbi:hypothetical protein C2869_18130 [Saccharobesus litoralis]|uniref:Uncharacterized protein n=2 Tax=Saccharobesus litoralis TaxID=2172099 RepID=A0A2S0VVL2_9ALTE|nr:hypothetical protein C2869_18130 [Saccharobesus litoralis]
MRLLAIVLALGLASCGGGGSGEPPQTEVDSDKDGVPDNQDAFPNDPTETKDSDSDGVGDNADKFPDDPNETKDSDGDGIGDNADKDRDNDGVDDNADAFPDDPTETKDTDSDGVGDNADKFPTDATETHDLDNDGVGDNSDPDKDGDGVNNDVDAFPEDKNESKDTDGDGVGDNADPDRDGDGVNNDLDDFPDDKNETTDTDKDGIGNVADTDDDGDGMPDTFETQYQLDPLVNDANQDKDNDGLTNIQEHQLGTAPDTVNQQFTGDAYGQANATITFWDKQGAEVSLVSQSAAAVSAANDTTQTDASGLFTFFAKQDVTYPLLVKAAGTKDTYSFVFESGKSVTVSDLTSVVAKNIFEGTKVGQSVESRFASVLANGVSDLKQRSFLELSTVIEEIKQVSPNFDFGHFSLDKIFAGSADLKTQLTQTSAVTTALKNKVEQKPGFSGVISGVITEQTTKKPVSGVNVFIEGEINATTSDIDGQFILRNVPVGKRLAVTFTSQHYAPNQKIIEFDDTDLTTSTSIKVKLKPVQSSIPLSKITLGGVVVASEDGKEQLRVATNDQSVSLLVSPSFVDKVLQATNKQRRAARGGVLAASESANASNISLDITSIDPTNERDIFPGNFEARDLSDVSAANEEQAPITLESVVLSDFTLRDENGNELAMPDGETITARLEIPATLQTQYRAEFEAGIRTIPWWSYNEVTGEWVWESEATLLDVNGTLYAEAVLTHFSWWNVDKPISTHAEICGRVVDGSGNPILGADVIANGISYNGNSNDVTDASGGYSMRVKKLSTISVAATFADITRSINVSVTNQGVNQGCQNQVDIEIATVEVSGTVRDQNDQALEGVKLLFSNGTTVFTDSEGKYSVNTATDLTLKIKASIIKNELRHSTSTEVVVQDIDVTHDITVITDPVEITGVISVDVLGTVSPLSNAVITAQNGQVVKAATDGSFVVTTPSKEAASAFVVEVNATLPSGLVAKRSFDLTPSNQDIDLGSITFVDQVVTVIGKVLDPNGKPLRGIDVVSSLSIGATTDNNGEYRISVPAGQQINVSATYRDTYINVEETVTTATVVIPSDATEVLLSNLRFKNTLPATVTGTVREKDTSTPLAGVTIVTSLGETVVTNERGVYTLRAPVASNIGLDYSFDYADDNGQQARFGAGSDSVATGASGSTTTKNLLLDLVSNPPSILSVALNPKVVSTNESVEVSVFAKDPDGDPLTINIAGQVVPHASQTLQADGSMKATVTLTSQATQGTQTFKVTATEDVTDPSPSATRNVQLIVKANSVPAVIELIGDVKTLRPGEGLTLSAKAYDIDGDVISYRWQDGQGNTVVTDSNNYFFVVPVDTADGEYTATLTVEDAKHDANFNSLSFTYFVQSNRAPIITGVFTTPATTVTSGTEVRLNAVASDPDGNTVSYLWQNANDETVSTTRTLEFVAPDVTAEIVVIYKLTVSDGEKQTTQSVAVIVEPVADNQPTEPEEEASLSGFVTDPSGTPIAGALIEIYNVDRSVDVQTASDVTGFYQFFDIPAGDYFVVVTRDGFTLSSSRVQIQEQAQE